jgi:isoamylase
LRQDGSEMTDDEWHAGWIRCLGLRLSGEMLDDVNSIGQPIKDDTFLLLLNSHHEGLEFCLPETTHPNIAWELCFDTASPDGIDESLREGNFCFTVAPRSVAVFKQVLGHA